MCNREPHAHTRRLRILLHAINENLACFRVRFALRKTSGVVENVFFTRLHLGGALVFQDSGPQVAACFLNRPEQVVQFRFIVLALESEESRTGAAEAIRALVEAIVLEPDADQLKITLKGDLTGMLSAAETARGRQKPATSWSK